MTHQAIARKWRPRLFEEIAGQIHVTRTLQNAIRLGRVHHAFLLTGARGVGKTSAARILARALNCEQGPAENPCNECSSCSEMLAGNFPDLVEIDAASHNSVDNIRDLVEKVQYTPQRARYKIYIIDEVHMVTKQGFNALLKTLEEPPAHVIFILATTDPQQLLDTVISRCQRFDFKMIPGRTIYERLKFVAEQEGVGVPDSSLKVIAREGGGSMRDAQSLLDQVLSFSGESVSEQEVAEILGFIDRSILYGILESTLTQDPGAALTTLSKVALYGYDVRTFANQLLESVRNVALTLQVPDAEELLDLPDEEIQRLKTLAQDRDSALLSQQFDILAQAVDGIARSEQPMLLLEMAAVKMASVRPLVPIAKMLGRLEALERRLRRGGAGGGGGAPEPSRSSDDRSYGAAATGAQHSSASAPEPPPHAPAAPEPAQAPQQLDEPEPESPDDAPVSETRAAPLPPGDVLDSLINYKRGSINKSSDSTPQAETTAKPKATGSEDAIAAAGPQAADTVQTEPEQSAGPAPSEEPTAAVSAEPTAAVSAEPTAAVSAEPTATEGDPGDELREGAQWRKFVHALGSYEEIAPLQALLITSGFLAREGQQIRIGFGSELTLRQAQRLGEHPRLATSIQEHFGEGVTLCFELDAEGRGEGTLGEELERIRSEHHDRLESAARNHPAVERALDTFPGASVEGVHVPPLREIHDVR